MTLEEIYQQKCVEICDINEHLPVLREYASRCRHVTEFGVRGIVSTWALLAGVTRPPLGKFDEPWGYVPMLISYDQTSPGPDAIMDVMKAAASKGKIFKFVCADVRTVEIDETDLLFIDTFHTYTQLKKELELHGNKARKFIIMHDTETFGIKGEAGNEVGLLPAIEWFLTANPFWTMRAQYYFNNGLTILERK